MSTKQTLIDAVGTLPETASWLEITNALLSVVARRGSESDFARLYRTQLTSEHLAEYANPVAGIPISDFVATLEARDPFRNSA